MSLYETLKAAKIGAVPDVFTTLRAQIAPFAKSSGTKEKELEGTPPLSFSANGDPLIDWIIDGASGGVGDATSNLYFTKISANGIDASGKIIGNSSFDTYVAAVESGKSYIGTGFVYAFYDDMPKQDSVAYNNTRIVANASEGITAPINGYIAVRHNAGVTNAMFNVGTTAKSYEPYGYKIPISSAGQTTPVYLGEVQTTRKIRKMVLDGTEDWALSSTPNAFYMVTTLANAFQQAPVCSHFKGSTTVTADNIIVISETQRINIRTTSIPHNLTDWKNYLQQQYAAGMPVTVWYALATEETGIVNEPLMKIGDYADTVSKAQADATIPTNNGSTTVDVDTTVKPSEVYIKYRT